MGQDTAAGRLATRRERPLWRRWVLATTVGEAIGFCLPALAGVVTVRLNLPTVVGFAVQRLVRRTSACAATSTRVIRTGYGHQR